mmetsp:Transcript_11508/g.18173  ORF Transcript_11508/g.18173 Transcript_11508/m.18173 type:complete len:121 (+) Transcript_11508:158-520(+)
MDRISCQCNYRTLKSNTLCKRRTQFSCAAKLADDAATFLDIWRSHRDIVNLFVHDRTLRKYLQQEARILRDEFDSLLWGTSAREQLDRLCKARSINSSTALRVEAIRTVEGLKQHRGSFT